ncbi:type II toxin-antitoxin system YoeB family toxin [Alteromonas portus]|uniref:Type II toxin-antitoxin system YoeB family toxin n=1 Tax=Alteromonas portus TaxID=2565549 RepID=A0A4U0ZKA6_9ALTE|nr:type II toxin-antitoxin system YoeB family toxin [Alteromonas portus]HBA56973.1 hypothetical protein [Alteromonas macleodii]
MEDTSITVISCRYHC